MDCQLCDSVIGSTPDSPLIDSIILHYKEIHSLTCENNVIFLQYLRGLKKTNRCNVSVCRLCFVITNSDREYQRHMLSRHKQYGGANIDSSLVDVNSDPLVDGKLWTATISYSKHLKSYGWKSTSLINTFLTLAENAFNTDYVKGMFSGDQFMFYVSFTLVNKKGSTEHAEYSPPRNFLTASYKGKGLTKVIKVALGNDIGSKVINNGESGSQWQFVRFDRMTLHATDQSIRGINKIYGGDNRICTQEDGDNDEEEINVKKRKRYVIESDHESDNDGEAHKCEKKKMSKSNPFVLNEVEVDGDDYLSEDEEERQEVILLFTRSYFY